MTNHKTDDSTRRGQTALDEAAKRHLEKGHGTDAYRAKGANGAKPRVVSCFRPGERGANGGEFSPDALLRRAKKVLFGQNFDLPEYPAEALGPLAQTAQAVAVEGQTDIAMAGQSVLAAAALCAQANANVETLAGVMPLSLYALTIGESGDGKTTAETAALQSICKFERDENRRYRNLLENYELDKSERKKGDPPPERPKPPYLLMSDATIEGVRRSFSEGRPSQGVFSSEGAAMLAGHGMKPENKAKTAAELNRLWDRGEVSVSRGSSGRLQLYDRRLSCHLMIQPTAVEEILIDELLTTVGFWPRFLLAWPEPAKPRRAKPFRPETIPAIGRFWQRCFELLPSTEREECADIPTLELTDEARKMLGAFFEGMEQQAKGKVGRYTDACKPFALRASEQACRIAGVLAVYDDADCIGATLMECGIKLALYSVDSWRAVFNERDRMNAAKIAYRYLEWMVTTRRGQATEIDMLKNGPKPRSASRRDTAISTLHASGLIFLADEIRPPVWVASLPEVRNENG
ncbi:MAG: DUF3987 domain-containing protein [Methylohalobius sp. ZOD2]